ncbi:MAG: winged helix-turn-helix transcriptional regulator [Candidatus Aenigmarchaeota archaeon]|nr:winged helix-turn-helix transcriptional regulator [Candidatus Aenigmarchaeota archaeon]
MIQFDRRPNYEFDWKEDFNKKAFENFREIAGIPKDLSVEHVLKNLNLITDEKVNNAGVLFFCNDLRKFFINAGVVVVLYRTPDKADVMDIKEFCDDFVTNYENVMKYIMIFLSKEIEIKGLKRIENPEIPEEALREALINAMVHRDYFIQGRVQIDIYPDRLEITNPGKLLFDEKDLGNISIARNPIIFDLAHRLHYVEKIGSGIRRIRNLVPDVEFKIGSNWFRVVFKRKLVEKFPEKWSERWSELSERQKEIVRLLEENPRISRAKLAEKLGINPSAVQKHLKKLKEKGIITRVGPAKGGYWKVLK